MHSRFLTQEACPMPQYRTCRSTSPYLWSLPLLLGLSGCASLGSLMSPYSETFSCKNSDHGQCLHPDKAYADAIAGHPSRSDPAVTRDKTLLKTADRAITSRSTKGTTPTPGAYQGYRDSLYHELQGLIEAPVTPMLKPSRTVRTLIMPYADRARPDRLYMPRYVYSLLDRPQWVIGDYLVDPVAAAARAPILHQVREKPADEAAVSQSARP